MLYWRFGLSASAMSARSRAVTRVRQARGEISVTSTKHVGSTGGIVAWIVKIGGIKPCVLKTVEHAGTVQIVCAPFCAVVAGRCLAAVDNSRITQNVTGNIKREFGK